MRFPRFYGRGTALTPVLFSLLLGLLVSSQVKAGQPEHLIQLNKVDFKVPVRVMQNSPVVLNNDWGVSLHQTTITQLDSRTNLASIKKLMAGQSVSLEFPREGSYSICYFLTPDGKPEREQCFFIKVVPFKAA